MIAEELARWGTSPWTAPPEVDAAVRRHLLDALGTACAAARLDAAAPAVTVARGLGGPAEATVIGFPGKIGAPAAALANGTLIHALDFDDTHAGGLVHATAPVLPAVLAVGEEVGASGAQALAALAVGLETVCRLGAAVPHGFHARGLHATSACGVFAAALAAARLYRLPPERAAHALGIAGSLAGGLLECVNTGAATKQLHPGFAAQAGILAARLASAGATGPASVFEGTYGLYGVHADRRVEPRDVLAGLGEVWELTRITIKPYPVCQLGHAALDAGAALRARLGGREAAETVVSTIVEIVVEIHPDAAQFVCGPGKERPASAYAAKFSLPWCLAQLLLDGELTVASFERLDRPEVIALAERVRHELVTSPGAAADQPGRVSALLGDGTRVTAVVDRSGGGPDDPRIEDLVRGKARANLGARAETVLALVADLPSPTALMTALEAHP
ncbi:MmgE/PrpD family protein [Nonomuraea spiralis]|uniref:MmgE/PrpD family protein n=1 Tax=Nonomuraea spiralis TaxID=46182 RepID=A0ABV5ISZ2_9ACTN|nr:MmgE/PrpD family protein [Nonomuraea spiralis]GGT16975.1 MmgE/Prp family protein [Nonomuraea spiralis]